MSDVKTQCTLSDVKISLIVWQGASHQHIQTSATRLEGGNCVYVEERLRKYGSLGKSVIQGTRLADLVAEEYPTVSLANKAGDESRNKYM